MAESTGHKIGDEFFVDAQSSHRMSEAVIGKGAINLLDYRSKFHEQYENPKKANQMFERWCCRVKDQIIRLSGVDLRPYQKEFSDKIVRSVIRNDGELFLGEWARQSGKTETLASTGYAISVLFAPVRIGIFAPKQRQAHIMWNRMKERYNPELMNSVGIEVERYGGSTFQMSNGSVIEAITCGSGNIEGETFDLIFIDETQKISRRMILSEIWPMGAETNATRVVIGTPSFEDCWFREQVERLEGTSKCMIYDWRIPAKYSQNYREYLSKMLNEMTPESEEFRTQFKLEWILEEGMFMSRNDWNRMQPPKTLAPYIGPDTFRTNADERNKWRTAAGVDLAKQEDSTVITVLGKYEGDMSPYHDDVNQDTIVLLDVVELQGMEYPDQYDVIQETMNKWDCNVLGVDSTGLGDPVTDTLKRKLSQHVEEIDFTRQKKHDLYKHVERKVKVGEERQVADFIIPAEFRDRGDTGRRMRRMEKQFLNLVKDYRGSLMKVEAQDSGKDDYPDSAAMAMWVMDADYSEHERSKTATSPVLGTVG